MMRRFCFVDQLWSWKMKSTMVTIINHMVTPVEEMES